LEALAASVSPQEKVEPVADRICHELERALDDEWPLRVVWHSGQTIVLPHRLRLDGTRWVLEGERIHDRSPARIPLDRIVEFHRHQRAWPHPPRRRKLYRYRRPDDPPPGFGFRRPSEPLPRGAIGWIRDELRQPKIRA
jgi:hypothetical protein